MPKYNSAENDEAQQCRKLMIFGTVEHIFIFGTVVLRYCCTSALLYCPVCMSNRSCCLRLAGHDPGPEQK